MKRILAPGVFDCLHIGHVNFLAAAARLKDAANDRMFVAVQDGRDCGKELMFPLAARMKVVEALKGVDQAVSYRNPDLSQILKCLRVTNLVVSEEYGCSSYGESAKSHLKTLDTCNAERIAVHRVKRTKDVCSTDIRAQANKFWDEFEGRGHLSSNRDTKAEVQMILDGMATKPGLAGVVDWGCAGGRILRPLSDLVSFALGVDRCQRLIEIAAEDCPKADTWKVDVAELVNREATIHHTLDKHPMDLHLVNGILPYLDDDTVAKFFRFLNDHTRWGGQMALMEPIGINGQVDVMNQFSDALHALYSARFRTYTDLGIMATDAGWKLGRCDTIQSHHPDTSLVLAWFAKE